MRKERIRNYWLLTALLMVVLLMGGILAADVAYIYKKEFKIDNNVLDVFSDLGLSVDLVDESDMPGDFSEYRFIFAGDERFKKASKIPVDDMPSIVSNYYFGHEWGLTDSDGISKLASNSPLSVRKNGGVVQVYTKAKYNLGGDSIPYYYLDDENKVPAMQKIAGTYTGNTYDFGDVISYANAGTDLINGKVADGNICFFGIIESDFWTPQARDMFIDCINFVAMICSDDSDCGEDGFTGDKYCQNDNVYQDYREFTCLNPGTVNSECDSDIESRLIEQCSFGCVDGDCLGPKDCQDGLDNDLDDLIDCQDPGCWTDLSDPQSCDPNDDSEDDATIVCNQDSDCGVDGYIGDNYCYLDDVYRDYEDVTCLNPGTGLSECSSDISKVLIEECSFGCADGDCIGPNDCQDNVDNDLDDLIDCQDPGCWTDLGDPQSCNPDDDSEDDATIVCNQDSDCGTDGYVGDNYCSGDDVYRDYKEFTCLNPGTGLSECSSDVEAELIEECSFGCVDGDCLGPNDCQDNVDNDLDDLIDCQDPGCWTDLGDPQSCDPDDDSEDDGTIVCNQDSDCGVDGYVGDRFCQLGDVYQDYKEFTCLNPGTGLSECSSDIEAELIEECAFECVDGACTGECSIDDDCSDDYYSSNYCSGDDVYKDLHDFSCVDEECVEEVIKELVEDCADICVDGECVDIACYGDSDCGVDGYVGDNYCTGDDVYRDYKEFTCSNPGTVDSECGSSVGPVLVEECSDTCIDGECVDITCYNDSECGEDGFIGDNYCSGDDVFRDFKEFTCLNPGTGLSECSSDIESKLVDECAEVCVDGECLFIECYQDSDCDDHTMYTYDECNNPGTIDSYCSNIIVNCVTDNDCGPTGYVGDEFCSLDDVYKNYQNSTCVNPATLLSYCDISLTQTFLIDCGEDFCEDWGDDYCKGDDVYHSRRCYEKSCDDGMCYTENPSEEEELVEECLFECVDGECTGECSVDDDCSDDFYSENYCLEDDVYKDLHDFSCSDFECVEDIVPELVEDCSFDCIDGECVEGFHDVGFVDFTNSINQVFLEYVNGTDILDAIPVLDCRDVIKAKVKVENKGDYTEDVTLDGNLNGNVISFNDINGLSPGSSSQRTSLTPYISLDLSPGLYNIIINANIPVDDNLADNQAQRQIEIVCPDCLEDDDCSDDYYSENYCLNDDVYKDLHDFFCDNGECVEDVIPELVEDCGEDICGDWGDNYCKGDDAYRSRMCGVNGCENGECVSSVFLEEDLVEECADTCVDGECVNITCHSDSDCGSDGFIGDNYCTGDDIYKDYEDFTCLNPGTVDSECDSDISKILIEECAFECVNGVCTGECNVESDCGTDGLIGDLFCQNNDVHQNYQDFECLDSECSNDIFPELVEDCGEDSCGDWGDNYCKGDDAYRSRMCGVNGCENGECVSSVFLEEDLVEECADTCVDGECVEIVCDKNSDCGTDLFTGDLYCKNNDVYRNFKTFTCNNPGTPLASCSNSNSGKLKQDCGVDSCGNWGNNYCKNDDVYHSRTCYDKGCSGGSCFNNPSVDEKKVKDCAHGCANGKCKTLTVVESASKSFNAAHAPLYNPPSIGDPNFQCIDWSCTFGRSKGLFPVLISSSSGKFTGSKLKIASHSGTICSRVGTHGSCSTPYYCKSCCCRRCTGCQSNEIVYYNNPNIKVGFYSSKAASSSNHPLAEYSFSSLIGNGVTIPLGTKYIYVYYIDNNNYFDNNVHPNHKMTFKYEIISYV